MAISYKGAKEFGADNNTGEVEAISFIILHGAAHNSGLGHDLGGTEIMNRASTLKLITQIGNGATKYVDRSGQIQTHDQSMIGAYKDNSSLGTLTSGDKNKKYSDRLKRVRWEKFGKMLYEQNRLIIYLVFLANVGF